MKILVVSSAVSDSSEAASIHARETIHSLSNEHEIFVISQLAHGLVSARNVTAREIRIPFPAGTSAFLTIVQTCLFVVASFFVGFEMSSRFEFDVIYARHGVDTVGAIFLGRILSIPVVLE